ncbi:transposase [Sporolactobacillus pectinivorans]
MGQHLWAPGYFCRTVGAMTEERIKEYIDNQDNGRDDETFKIVKD